MPINPWYPAPEDSIWDADLVPLWYNYGWRAGSNGDPFATGVPIEFLPFYTDGFNIGRAQRPYLFAA